MPGYTQTAEKAVTSVRKKYIAHRVFLQKDMGFFPLLLYLPVSTIFSIKRVQLEWDFSDVVRIILNLLPPKVIVKLLLLTMP